MNMYLRVVKKWIALCITISIIILFAAVYGNSARNAYAQAIATEPAVPTPAVTSGSKIEVLSPHFSVEQTTFSDGTQVSGYIINGPPAPLPEYEAERLASITPIVNATVLPNFPSYNWVLGCSAVSGAMIAGYYDRGVYQNVYTGPANGGVMPLTDTSWPTWSDGSVTYPNNPLIASHMGVDGRATRGTIDDYWISYRSVLNDPYVTHGWTQHSWGTAIGDYMKTSHTAAPYNNADGSTKFYNYTNSGSKLTCSYMVSSGIADKDGTYGRKLFYEARGYKVTDCYNQNTDNRYVGGFSLANFKAEIDAGHPVILNLYGHSVVGYGYDGSTIYIRDTWDNDPNHTYTMPWGGSYEGMSLMSVSIVRLTPAAHSKRLYMPMVIKPRPPNQSPTDILLSNNKIMENQPINTVIGSLSTLDPNAGDKFTYSLVSGVGDTGNASFNISGNQLRSSVIFNYENQNSYSIRIRATDQGSLFFDKVFTITITSAGEGVQILPNQSHYVDSVDYLHIVGEVQNNTGNTLRFVRLNANIYNSSGQLLDTEYTYTWLDNLPAWDKTCFEVLMPQPAGWSYYELETPTYWTDGQSLPNLTVLNVSGSYDSTFGWYTIIGQVRNDHGIRVEYVSPVGTLYNAAGVVIGCDFTYVDSTHLDPNQISAFEMYFFGRDYSDAASYRLQVDGDPAK